MGKLKSNLFYAVATVVLIRAAPIVIVGVIGTAVCYEMTKKVLKG